MARHVFVMITSITEVAVCHILFIIGRHLKFDAKKRSKKNDDDYNLEVISGPIGR